MSKSKKTGFRWEEEMIPVLINSFASRFGKKYYVKEFRSSNGIADLVLTDKVSQNAFHVNEFIYSLYINNYFHENQKVVIDEVVNRDNLDGKKFLELVSQLEKNGFLENKNGTLWINKQPKPRTEYLISIEAKLTAWKKGFFQALRYQYFSHESYLALPFEQIKNVDLQKFMESNVGLIAVSQECIEIIYEPKIQKPKDEIEYYYLSNDFANRVNVRN